MSEKKTVINKETMIPLGFVGVIATLVLFGADLRHNNMQNSTTIEKLNKKLDSEIEFSKLERERISRHLGERMERVEKEQLFLRERMIESMREIRRVVYKIEGKIEALGESRNKGK